VQSFEDKHNTNLDVFITSELQPQNEQAYAGQTTARAPGDCHNTAEQHGTQTQPTLHEGIPHLNNSVTDMISMYVKLFTL